MGIFLGGRRRRAPELHVRLHMTTEKAPDWISVRTTSAAFWGGLLLLMLLQTFLPPAILKANGLTFALKFLVRLLAGFWVYADALARNWEDQRARGYLLASAIIPEIAVPVYAVKSRGWKGAGLLTLKFFGLFLALSFAVYLAGIIARYFGISVSI